jgi:hypothetical protein
MVAMQCAGAEASFRDGRFWTIDYLQSQRVHNTPGDSAAIVAPTGKQCKRKK